MTLQQTEKKRKYYRINEIVKIKETGQTGKVMSIDIKNLTATVQTFVGDGYAQKELKFWEIDKVDYMKSPLKIHVKYFDETLPKLEKINIGDWIDLRAAKDVNIEKDSFELIPLGVAMSLPRGYEANIVPRSSTYKNFKIIQTNHYGVVDESYRGNDDQWFFPAYALEDTVIKKGDRICQFRIQRKMPEVEFVEVKELTTPNRGGHGSTGVN